MGDKTFDYAIVGGGIAGLYCAFHVGNKLQREPKRIALFEATDRLGGRIETWRINAASRKKAATEPVKVNQLIEQNSDTRGIDLLTAEFGPMRFEPDHQPYLKKLFEDLEIADEERGKEKWSDSISFPPYQSPPSDQPKFALEGEEAEQQNLIHMLLLALRRIFEVVEFADGVDKENPWKKQEPWWNIKPSKMPEYNDANHKPFDEANFSWQQFRNPSDLNRRFWKRDLMQWIMLLDEPAYQYITDNVTFRNTSIKHLGFWNVVSAVLSHMATTKLRDWGNFYHFLPENPSAATWIVFWLRNIKTSNSLKGIRGGTDLIIHLLCKKLGFVIDEAEDGKRHYVKYKNAESKKPPQPALFLSRRLLEVKQEDCDGTWTTSLVFDGPSGEETFTVTGDVVLALPKPALRQIRFSCKGNSTIDHCLNALFDSVVAVPLLKCFFLVDQPFWPKDRGPNIYANTAPTRELHYKVNESGNIGLMMVYTDRPSLNYWSDLNWPNVQVDSDEDPRKAKDGVSLSLGQGIKFVIRNPYQPHAKIWKWEARQSYSGWDNQKFQNDILLRTFLLYSKEEGAEEITAERLLAAGMHDWSLEPHENACHAWRAGSEPTKIIKYFSAFTLSSDEANETRKTLHICGEAYSDYQAFMEGALRSAFLALASIFDRQKIDYEMEEYTSADMTLRTVNYQE